MNENYIPPQEEARLNEIRERSQQPPRNTSKAIFIPLTIGAIVCLGCLFYQQQHKNDLLKKSAERVMSTSAGLMSEEDNNHRIARQYGFRHEATHPEVNYNRASSDLARYKTGEYHNLIVWMIGGCIICLLVLIIVCTPQNSDTRVEPKLATLPLPGVIKPNPTFELGEGETVFEKVLAKLTEEERKAVFDHFKQS